MGQKVSAPDIDPRSREILLQYNIDDRQILELWKKFVKIDVHRNGFWSIAECYSLIGEDRSSVVAPMMEAVFSLACSHNDGELSFENMLVSLSSVCALTREEVLQLLFIVIDRDCSAVLSKRELQSFFNYKTVPPGGGALYCVFPSNLQTALALFQNGDWERVNFAEFAHLCDTYPNLSFCAFHLQELLRESLLGKSFWSRYDKERQRVFTLEGEGKVVTASKHLADGRVLSIKKPARITMREILEFVKERLPTRQINKGMVIKQKRTYNAEREEILLRAPLLSVVQNRFSVFHVFFEREIEKRIRGNALDETIPRKSTQFSDITILHENSIIRDELNDD